MFSKKLDFDNAAVLKSQVFRLINAGSKVQDSIHAQRMPNPTVRPYPVMEGIGDAIIVKKAPAVVIDVRKIGNES